VTLEELQIPYDVHPVNLSANEQKQDRFLKICPNGRIPAIVDRDADDLAIFESGAIMIYLAEKAGRVLPGNAAGRANVFYRYFPIADIANWCWVRTYKWSGVECDDLVQLKRWRDEMRVRPACETGVNVPAKVENLEKNPEAAKKFADNARNMVQT